MLYKADTPRLRSRAQNIHCMFSYFHFCCYFKANGQNHIHFRLIQLRFLGIALHDIFSLSDHFPASWNLDIPCDLVESEEQILLF